MTNLNEDQRENPLTCAFARRISKPFRNFEMGLESGKLQIRSITTSSCRGQRKRSGHAHGLSIAHSHRVLKMGLFHAKALLHKHPWMLWVKL